jgi:hypothetical protein
MAVVTATEGPVPAVDAVPAVVAAETAVVTATDGRSDGWYWTLSGRNDCHPRSHNSWHRTISIWHSSDGWYWTFSGCNDCVVAAGTVVVPATEGPVPAVATVPAVVAAGMAVVTATEGPEQLVQ